MTELTDDHLCDIARSTQTAEPGRDGYVLPVAFARAVIAAHRGQQDHEIERLKDAEEGAKEAFGHVVQQKNDLESKIVHLQGLLDGAHAIIRTNSAKEKS